MPLSSFSLVFGHDSRPYRLRRHDRDLQTPVTGLLRPGLGFGQVTFPDDAFVRFVDTLDPVLILAGTLRQFFGDFINTAVGEVAHWGQELYSLADVKFMGMHGVSAPRRSQFIAIAAAVYQAIIATQHRSNLDPIVSRRLLRQNIEH